MKKKFLSLIILIITMFTFLPRVDAASLSISANTKSVVTGGSVSVTVKANGLAGKFSITSSNGNVLSGGTNSVWLENESKTYTFSAKNIGSATIKVTPVDVADSNGNVFSTSQSVTINVVKPREKSTNNDLKSLSVDGYTLSPEFDKDTLEYTVELDASVEKIMINGTKEDGYASIEGTGEKEVQEGNNRFEITVTSETGKSKVYVISAIVEDDNPIIKTINGKDYTVVKRASALIKLESFEEKTVMINDTEIPALYNETLDITLIGLKDDNGQIDLYRYLEETDTCSKYESLTSVSKTIIFENVEEEISGYEKTTVTIDDNQYTVYQNTNYRDYLLIYGLDKETGKIGWYLYNTKEKSIQSYMGDIKDNTRNIDESIKEYKAVILGMSLLSLCLLSIIVIQMLMKNKAKKNEINEDRNIADEEEDIFLEKKKSTKKKLGE